MLVNIKISFSFSGNPRKASAETPQRPSLDDPKAGRKGRKTTQQSTDI